MTQSISSSTSASTMSSIKVSESDPRCDAICTLAIATIGTFGVFNATLSFLMYEGVISDPSISERDTFFATVFSIFAVTLCSAMRPRKSRISVSKPAAISSRNEEEDLDPARVITALKDKIRLDYDDLTQLIQVSDLRLYTQLILGPEGKLKRSPVKTNLNHTKFQIVEYLRTGDRCTRKRAALQRALKRMMNQEPALKGLLLRCPIADEPRNFLNSYKRC